MLTDNKLSTAELLSQYNVINSFRAIICAKDGKTIVIDDCEKNSCPFFGFYDWNSKNEKIAIGCLFKKD
jgi:hypothetical protein